MEQKIKPIYPSEQISADQDQWAKTPEAVLRTLLWEIETGQIKPKEIVVSFCDRKDGKHIICARTAGSQSTEKIVGLLRLSERVLIDDAFS